MLILYPRIYLSLANLGCIVQCFDLSGEFTHAWVLPEGIFWFFEAANFVNRALSNKVSHENRGVVFCWSESQSFNFTSLSWTPLPHFPHWGTLKMRDSRWHEGHLKTLKKALCKQFWSEKKIPNKMLWVDLSPSSPLPSPEQVIPLGMRGK